MTHTRGDIARLLSEHGLTPSRALGQNFVADPNTVRRIAALAEVGEGDDVLEIGAGLGSLTISLADTGARVVALETDRHLVAVLQKVVTARSVSVVQGDAMTIELGELFGADDHRRQSADSGDSGRGSWTLVANLPYNIAVPVIARFLDDAPQVTRFLVMVQREVGERLVAQPKSKAYGAVSVKVAYYCTANIVGKVPATVFVPRPRVESVLVRMRRRETVAVDPAKIHPDLLFSLVRTGFSQRRKMLRKVLGDVVGPNDFESAGVDPRSRAEELSVEQWGSLACRLAESCTEGLPHSGRRDDGTTATGEGS